MHIRDCSMTSMTLRCSPFILILVVIWITMKFVTDISSVTFPMTIVTVEIRFPEVVSLLKRVASRFVSSTRISLILMLKTVAGTS